MIPRTLHKLATFEVLSAMQKCIRRGMEREAMEFACELGHTSKGFATMVVNRLLVISHEDIGIGDPTLIPLVAACCQQAKQWYDPDKLGMWRMAVGSAIRAMCRCKLKSREGDHFQGAVGLRNLLLDEAPEVPDWALDSHTHRGRKLGRGLQYFRTHSAQLNPAPKKQDRYESECYEMWEIRDARKGKGKAKRGTADNDNQETLF